jgi:hypothetical protein
MIQGFSYFCMMIEGSGSRAGTGCGSIPLISRSGSGRPKIRGSGGSGSGILVRILGMSGGCGGCSKLLIWTVPPVSSNYHHAHLPGPESRPWVMISWVSTAG